MADDARDSRRGSFIHGVVFGDFVDRALYLAKVRSFAGFCAAGTLQVLRSRGPLTQKLAIAAVAINVKGAKLCKYIAKTSQ